MPPRFLLDFCRFVLLQRWQQEVIKVTRKNAQSRHAQHKLEDQRRRAAATDSTRRRVRADLLSSWTSARLKDDRREKRKREGALSIASELQKTSTVDTFSSLQERYMASVLLLTHLGRIVGQNGGGGTKSNVWHAGASTRSRGRLISIAPRASSPTRSSPRARHG